MAGGNGKSGGRRHPVLLWVALLAFDIGFVVILAPTATLQRFLHDQQTLTVAMTGASAAREVNLLGARWFRDTLIRTDAISDMQRWTDPHRVSGGTPFNETVARVRGVLQARLDAVWWLFYVAFYRAAVIAVWLPYAIPVLAAALWDGWIRRRISKWRFEFSSPMRHRYASRGAGGLVLLAAMIPVLPLPIPPLAIPFALGVLAVTARFWVASIQKRV